MKHIIYQTTNNINKKIYIGYHYQTTDPYTFDGYWGSGVKLINAIKKHGVNNFTRETLFVFDDEKVALEKELEIVNETFIKRADVYNIVVGGGLPPSHKGIPKSKIHKQKIGNSNKGKILSEETINKIRMARSNQIISHSEETKQKIANALLGKKHTEQRKQNMRDNQPDRSGINNPCFGKQGYDHPAFGTKRHLIQCPHCSKEVPVNVVKRWHFDNCKSNLAKS
jgi:GIY-YIG catalytic domain/NUMOD3 motif